ncbi:MAG: hypothetical protein JSW58_12780 [Candidatus Latescibacterota bacterium]|nr:MAG: hypothetical protein JSW58_12780 [Candidatus Latescibacterota bacterium]
MKYVLLVMLAVLTALVYLPSAQGDDPPSWVDIRADSLTFGFPAPDSIRLTGHYTVFNGMLMDTIIVSDVGFWLDGVPVGGEPIDVTKSLNNCYVFTTPEDCKGECYFSSVPPIEFGECEWFESDPMDTIFIAEPCVCTKSFSKTRTVLYSGEDMATFELDPGGVVEELREWNNSITVSVGSVATEPSTWGRIKALFEE